MTHPPNNRAEPRALPAPPPDPDALPTALTFFLSMDERSRVLERLKRRGRDRRLALLAALRLEPTPEPGTSRDA